MPTPTNADLRAAAIENAAQRIGIPISRAHAQLAATWGDSLHHAVNNRLLKGVCDVRNLLRIRRHVVRRRINPILFGTARNRCL